MDSSSGLNALLRLIEDAIAKDISDPIEDISSLLGTDEPRLSHIFKYHTGIRLQSYIEQRLLRVRLNSSGQLNNPVIETPADQLKDLFEKYFHYPIESFGGHLTWLQTLVTDPLPENYVTVYKKLKHQRSERVYLEKMEVAGVKRTIGYHEDRSPPFYRALGEVWEGFIASTRRWDKENKKLMLLTFHQPCFQQPDGYHLIASTEYSELESALPQNMVRFSLPERVYQRYYIDDIQDIPAAKHAIFRSLLANNSLTLNKQPLIWEPVKSGGFYCYVSTKSGINVEAPQTLRFLDPVLLPEYTISSNDDKIGLNRGSLTENITALVVEHADRLSDKPFFSAVESGELVLLGYDENGPCPPVTAYNCAAISERQSPSNEYRYLPVEFVGNAAQFSFAIAFIAEHYFPEQPFLLANKAIAFADFHQDNETFSITLYFPVCDRQSQKYI